MPRDFWPFHAQTKNPSPKKESTSTEPEELGNDRTSTGTFSFKVPILDDDIRVHHAKKIRHEQDSNLRSRTNCLATAKPQR